MTTLLRKVWESVSNRSCSKSNRSSSSSPDRYVQFLSTGEFDRLPLDIFLQILNFLGPKEAAKLSAVCKCMKYLVSDNRVWIYFLQHQQEPWDSIFFAETNLRLGYPLQTFPSQMPELSFMHIYGQRTQLPGAVIIDGGSGYCKFGWSKYNSPSGQSATFLEFGNIESPMHSRLQHFYATMYSRMQVKSSTQPIVVSVPICQYDDTASAKAARRQLKEAIYSALFGMNVPAVCAINQATLALFAARRTSGIVVNIGFHQTSVVPILHGKVMRKVGVEVVGMGALKLTSFLREQMQQKNISFRSLYTVRSLKENLCYVALDYEAELSKDTQKSWEVTADGWFTLSRERFQTGEILFQPRIAGVYEGAVIPVQQLIRNIEEAVKLILNGSSFLSKRAPQDEAWLLKFLPYLPAAVNRHFIITGWIKPVHGRLKLNTDGCSKGNPGPSGGSFSFHVRTTSIKISSSYNQIPLLEGVQLCCTYGFHAIDIEVDSMVLAKVLLQTSHPPWGISYEVRKILGKLENMEFSIRHIFRESNMSADFLANFGCKVGKQCVFTRWHELPRRLKGIVRVEKTGLPNIRRKKRAMALHQAVSLCMDHCQDAELSRDDGWFKTVVLAGGTACLPGLSERLEKELRELLPSSMSNGIRVIPPPYGSDSAWFGAKLVSNVSTFPESWCVAKKQFRFKSRRDLIW